MHKIKRLRRLCKTMAKKRAYIILRSCKRLGGSLATNRASGGIIFTADTKLIYSQLDT